MEPTFIERLRQKPSHHRHMYAAGTSFAVVAVIFVVWLSVKTNVFHNQNEVVAQASVVQEQKTPSPFQTLKNSVAQVFTGFENARQGIKEKFGAKAEYQAE